MKNSKLPIWDPKNWEESEKNWDSQACEAAKVQPVKSLKVLPNMPGITKETAKNLKWKSLFWMITQDHQWKILKNVLKHPFRYGKAFLASSLKPKPFKRDGDLFFYGISNLEEFQKLIQNPDHLFVLGFSYCHKPFECPSGRFTSECIHDPENLVCRQCFIGKCMHAGNSKNIIPVIIPTIHYIGEKIFEIVHANPKKTVTFLITACELTLEMFGDLGNMVDIKGIGVRLDGRICNTMEAFKLSERGIKPGLTVVLEDTQKKLLDLLKIRQKSC